MTQVQPPWLPGIVRARTARSAPIPFRTPIPLHVHVRACGAGRLRLIEASSALFLETDVTSPIGQLDGLSSDLPICLREGGLGSA